MNEIDVLDSLIDSMRVYLNRKEILGYHKAWYKNILRIMTKLISLKPYDKVGKADLKIEILDIKTANIQEWFLEKLADK